ncbi:MAG: cupin domain-containing protein [Pseudomonadota bacterium]
MNREIYEAFMLDHAVGALVPGLKAAGDLHVRLSADGAKRASLWEMVGGALLEQDNSHPAGRSAAPKRKSSADTHDVQEILDADLDQLDWKSGVSGAKHVKMGPSGSYLMRMEPNQSVPSHSHSAIEATVVLAGRLEIDGAHYEQGDIAFGEPGRAHRPRATEDGECVCFVARGPRPFWRLT